MAAGRFAVVGGGFAIVRLRNLPVFPLAEIERCVQFGLAREQLLEPRVMLERAAGLGREFREALPQTFQALPSLLPRGSLASAARARCSGSCRPDLRG